MTDGSAAVDAIFASPAQLKTTVLLSDEGSWRSRGVRDDLRHRPASARGQVDRAQAHILTGGPGTGGTDKEI